MSQSANDIENYDSYGSYENDGVSSVIRALVGSLSIIGCMLCSVYCLYKYAVCQEKKDRQGKIAVKQYAMV